MRALVIGADGFAGRWLVRHLAESGDRVAAAAGPRFSPPLEGAAAVTQLDVRDAAALARAIEDAGPDVVYDLAGVSSRSDREDVDAAVGVTVVGAMNVLLGCAKLEPSPRLLFVSTGHVYHPSDTSLREDSALRPTSLYAAAKLAAERALLTVASWLGVEVVIARPFNHIGPGQADSFVVPTIARQIAAAIDAEEPATIVVRDAAVVRDFTDVRDVVRAYRILATHGRADEVYNIASGTATSVSRLAVLLGEAAGTEATVISELPAEPNSVRPLIGDASRIRALGWQPTFPLRITLADVMAAGSARTV
jgi:GDP-4-dehydro-6-deoxy-D-mannose reductase